PILVGAPEHLVVLGHAFGRSGGEGDAILVPGTDHALRDSASSRALLEHHAAWTVGNGQSTYRGIARPLEGDDPIGGPGVRPLPWRRVGIIGEMHVHGFLVIAVDPDGAAEPEAAAPGAAGQERLPEPGSSFVFGLPAALIDLGDDLPAQAEHAR